MTIIEKEIVINLDGKEGSAWVLLEYAREYAKDFLGLVSENDIESICDEMKDGDYENLLLVFDKYFGEYVLLARTPVLWPDDFDVDIAKEVLAQVYGTANVGATSPAPTRFAMVVPTSYQDVVPLIDEALVKLSPSQFVDSLFNNLIVTSQRDKDGWRRLAQQSVHDPIAKKILHED